MTENFSFTKLFLGTYVNQDPYFGACSKNRSCRGCRQDEVQASVEPRRRFMKVVGKTAITDGVGSLDHESLML